MIKIRGKKDNYRFLGRILPNELTEIANPELTFGLPEADLMRLIEDDPNIEVITGSSGSVQTAKKGYKKQNTEIGG